MKDFDFKSIEAKWKDKWFNDSIFFADDDSKKAKKYILVEFPYPSGDGLHMGHAFSFVGGDVYSRFYRHLGYNVLFPMGWDAFGLPAENYAIKTKRKPKDIVKENTDNFREEMKNLGLSIDWRREVNTTDPNYYKWTQWIFIKLFEKGLAYKEERPINWCPSCKIGLADEEAVDGKCERCGTQTEKRNISQWIVKITDYADRLIDGLKDTNFIEKVKAAQINWIDRKEWIDITYNIEGIDDTVTVATTRPDTDYGATFIVLAPEHEIVKNLISKKINTQEDLDNIKEYVRNALNKSELDRQKEVVGRDKTGVFTGLYAINQLTKSKMPIWITDFVLGSVGTGAVVGVPGHDIRDFEFAKQFNIPIIRVVIGKDGDKSEITSKEQVQEEEGVMINSGFLDGLDIHKAKEVIMDYLEKEGWGKKTVRYHLRDWIFSRQHYWGEPIPMIHCEKCGWLPVKEEELPIKLPDVDHYEPTDTGESPLANMYGWVNTICHKCNGPAKRETDTMPNWAGSDWYFLRYLDVDNERELAGIGKQEVWMPVDTYIGGDEHNTLHLLYSRFIYQFLYDLGKVTTPEPYDRRVSHGVILGKDNKRMSKSRGNGIVPAQVREVVGTDVVRTYLMFIGPFDATMPWSDESLNGVKRFINRVYSFISNNVDNFSDKDDIRVAKKMTSVVNYTKEAMTKFQFNTTIAKYMELINLFEKVKAENISKSTIKEFIVMLSPFLPFMCEELWEKMGETYSVSQKPWPERNETIVEDEIEIPIQINGKVRTRITISKGMLEKDVRKIIDENDGVNKYFDGKVIKKFVYVEGRIINIVV